MNSDYPKGAVKLKLGIFGGTFNPPHIGHLRLVEAVADELSLDRVLIIPAAIPPHKNAPDLADGEDRLMMCRLTFGADKRFEVSDTELRRRGRSYTYDTLCGIREQYPEDEIFLIVGSDMLETFDRWYRYRDILSMCTLCAAARERDFSPNLEKVFSKDELKKVRFINIDVTEVSSTQIRRLISEGGSAGDFLTCETAQYIEQRGLYR